jgi:peptide/nickel transport system permease protein
MSVYILRRLAQTALVLAVTSLLVFFGLYVVGDPVEILVNPVADEAERARAAAALGLDKPIVEQYWIFLRSAGRP